MLDRPPASWDERLAKLAADPGKALAPLLDDLPPEIVAGRRRLHPWWLRRDVSALLGWAEQLKTHPMGAVISSVPEAPGATQVLVAGTLLGEPVDLIAVTHRKVRGPVSGTVRWEAVLEVADAERAALLPELTDVDLPAEVLADPLMVTAGDGS